MARNLTGDSASRKLSYSVPALTVYGSVRDLTGDVSGGAGDMTLPATGMGVSDPAAKENVVRVGEHAAGFGLYLFDYKPEFRDVHGHGRQFGVMADEVETIVPEAVMVNADGYRVVNYTLLGITRH
jgi:hypothetical protein